MELDDLDEAQPISTDERSSLVSFTEGQTIKTTEAMQSSKSLVTSLYDEEESSIPTEINQVIT